MWFLFEPLLYGPNKNGYTCVQRKSFPNCTPNHTPTHTHKKRYQKATINERKTKNCKILDFVHKNHVHIFTLMPQLSISECMLTKKNKKIEDIIRLEIVFAREEKKSLEKSFRSIEQIGIEIQFMT